MITSRFSLRTVAPLFLAVLLALGSNAFAQGFSISITLDENGTGHFTNTAGFNAPLPGVLAPDPGPGGLPLALTYDLLNPPGLTSGDVLMLDPSNATSDIIRFNAPTGSTGSAVFYSLVGGGQLGDTGFPAALYANTATILEGATYTPVQGQPGFVAGAGGPVSYTFISGIPDTATTYALLSMSLAGLALLRRKLS